MGSLQEIVDRRERDPIFSFGSLQHLEVRKKGEKNKREKGKGVTSKGVRNPGECGVWEPKTFSMKERVDNCVTCY